MSARASRQQGVSLIEALVALAVMAFGMLGIVGVQSTLRFNSDVAKQRSEAVRIAQRFIEDSRSFMLVVETANVVDYSDIGVIEPPAITDYTTNTTYTVTNAVDVSGDTGASDFPRMKTLRVAVSWADRTSANQTVVLNTTVTRIMPELSGTLSLAANVGANGVPNKPPLGRNRAIPVQAVDLGNSSSGFRPPQISTGGSVLVFNNTTGVVTVCLLVDPALAVSLSNIAANSCGNPGQLLSGYVQFAYSATPTAATLEAAGFTGDTALNLDVTIGPTTSPVIAAPPFTCFDDAPPTVAGAAFVRLVAYYCVVTSDNNGRWSGISALVPQGQDGGPAWSLTAYKVCRYTPAADDTVTLANPLHPRQYLDVTTSDLMTKQNFLVIAGTASCPIDGTPTPSTGDFVNSNTLQHQP